MKYDVEIIKALQGDISLCPDPFRSIAEKIGISENELLMRVNEFLGEGKIRRFGAVLRHQNVGFKYNGMGVWNVPAEKVEAVAKIMVSFQEVSHCYERPRFHDWKYNLYTMIHAKDCEECAKIGREISIKTGIDDYDILVSTKEFKKSSVRYF